MYIGIPIQVKNKINEEKAIPPPYEAGECSSSGSRRPGHPHSTPWSCERAKTKLTTHVMQDSIPVLALVFLPGLYSAACRTGLPFLRNLLRMFFSCSTRISLSTTSYRYVVVFVSSAFFARVFFCSCFLFFFFSFLSLMCPFLTTMSFAGYFLARFIMSALFLRPTVFPVGLDLVSSIV